MAKEKKDPNRRAHLRYRDPECSVYNFTTTDEASQGFVGLVVNESFNGMAVVIVGDGNLEPGQTIFWKETPNIKTSCKVIRCVKLEEDIYRLALSIDS